MMLSLPESRYNILHDFPNEECELGVMYLTSAAAAVFINSSPSPTSFDASILNPLL